MNNISRDLNNAVAGFYEKYKDISDATASKRPEAKEWSLKEIIGHLINSAANNHQRFIGLQFVNEMRFPEYQEYHLQWIEREQFNKQNYADLLLLWKQYNIFLASLISGIDDKKLVNNFVYPDKTLNLRALIEDYVSHLKMHLRHFEETLQKVKK
jgi:hypothetical protein